MSRQSDFYNAVYDKAIELGANDVQARLAAAQASEETGFGKSMVGNNAFGIKAGSNYVGPSVTASTEEEYGGTTVRENANFRAYDDFTESVKDYLGVIQSNFPDAWSAPTFSEAVKGLNTGVYGKYATRAAYGQHIKAIDNKYGNFAFADDVGNVPTPYGPNDEIDLAGLPDDVLSVDDPNFAPIDHEFAYAANPANVPSQTLSSDQGLTKPQTADEDANGAFTDPGWGLNRNVAPMPLPTMNSWAEMAAATPVQAPVERGFLNAPAQQKQAGFANSFGDLAAAGPFGGDFVAPADRFAPAPVNQSAPFDRVVQTTSIPTSVDPNSYQPGTAPMVDTSAAPTNRVQSISITPDNAGFLNAPPSNQPISQADVDRAMFNVTGDGLMDPSFVESLMGPQSAVVPTAVETTSVTPGSMPQQEMASVDNSRFQSAFEAAPKTSRIGQLPGLTDTARMNPLTGLIDPATNTQSFMDQPAVTPADQVANIDNSRFTSVTEAAPKTSRIGQLSGLTDMARIDPLTGAINPATNVTGFLNSPAPALASVATPQQQAAGYQQMAAAAPNITNLSGTTGIWDDGSAIPSALTAPAVSLETEPAPDLETVEVADQPTVTDTQVSIPGPATTSAADQQQITAPAKATRTTPAATQTKSSFSDRISKALNPGTAIGAAIGAGFLGVPGAVAGGFLGNTVNGFLNAPSEPMSINNIGSSYDAVTSIWGGGQPVGTQATASDGQTVTSMPGGNVALTNSYGTTTVFDKSGKAMSYFGDGLSQEQDADTEGRESGGLFGGLFG